MTLACLLDTSPGIPKRCLALGWPEEARGALCVSQLAMRISPGGSASPRSRRESQEFSLHVEPVMHWRVWRTIYSVTQSNKQYCLSISHAMRAVWSLRSNLPASAVDHFTKRQIPELLFADLHPCNLCLAREWIRSASLFLISIAFTRPKCRSIRLRNTSNERYKSRLLSERTDGSHLREDHCSSRDDSRSNLD